MSKGSSPSENMREKTRTDENVEARLNLTLTGEPARILLELKRRKLVLSNHDAVNQALLALHERILNYDMKKSELEKIRAVEE